METPGYSSSRDGYVGEVVFNRGFYREREKEVACWSNILRCQEEIHKLRANENRQIMQVKFHYGELLKPYYHRRDSSIEKNPNFWRNAIINHPKLSKLVGKAVLDPLHYLKNIKVVEFGNMEYGFGVKFIFRENPFFYNIELVKQFYCVEPNPAPRSDSTIIIWKQQVEILSQQNINNFISCQPFLWWWINDNHPDTKDIMKAFVNDLWPNPMKNYRAPAPVAPVEDGTISMEYVVSRNDGNN